MKAPIVLATTHRRHKSGDDPASNQVLGNSNPSGD